MNRASIVTAALYPKGCEATHCRRFFSAIAWKVADRDAIYRAARRRYVPQRRADGAGVPR